MNRQKCFPTHALVSALLFCYFFISYLRELYLFSPLSAETHRNLYSYLFPFEGFCIYSQENVYVGNFDASLWQMVRYLYLSAQASGVESRHR